MTRADDRTMHQPDNLYRRYTPGGKVAHLIPDTDWQHDFPHALCGWWGRQVYWRGSGTQDEYDTAAALPTCRSCAKWVRRTNLDIGAAMTMAVRVHRGQVDKAGKPYLQAHVADVAARVRRADHQDDEGIVVAWLHDVLEDGSQPEYLEFEIRRIFGNAIVDAVVAITHQPGEPRDDYYARVKTNPIALRVKLADVASNTDPRRTALLDPATRDRLTAKYARALQVLNSEWVWCDDCQAYGWLCDGHGDTARSAP